jgi:hypothetical protein
MPTAALAGGATLDTSIGTRVTITRGAEANGAAQPSNNNITNPSSAIC